MLRRHTLSLGNTSQACLPAHDVPQLFQVVRGEVPISPVTASDVFVDAMQVNQVHVQCFLLQQNNCITSNLLIFTDDRTVCVKSMAYRIGLLLRLLRFVLFGSSVLSSSFHHRSV